MDMREYGQFGLHKTDAVGSGQELQQILQRIEILSKTMVASGVESDPDASLNMFLRGVGEAFEADRAYIFEFNDDGTSDNTFEWCAAGATPQFRSLQHVPVGAGVYHITGKEKSAGQAVDRTKIAGDAAYGDYFEYWRYYDPRMEEESDLRNLLRAPLGLRRSGGQNTRRGCRSRCPDGICVI